MTDEFIYLDYAATTPTDPRVAEIMQAQLTVDGNFGNPSSAHIVGRRAGDAIDLAAQQLAALLNCKPGELIWTSGATESDNLAITGAARYREHRGKHLITMPTEHNAVTDVFRALEQQGFDVTWLQPGDDGRLNIGDLAAALRGHRC